MDYKRLNHLHANDAVFLERKVCACVCVLIRVYLGKVHKTLIKTTTTDQSKHYRVMETINERGDKKK